MTASIVYANDSGEVVLTIPIAIDIYNHSKVELELRRIFMLEHLKDTIASLSRATLRSNQAGYRQIAYLAKIQRKTIKNHIDKIDKVLRGKA